jgi:hypothetical protein
MTKFKPHTYSFQLPTNLDQFNIHQLLQILNLYYIQLDSLQIVIDTPINPKTKTPLQQHIIEHQHIQSLISKLTTYLDNKFDPITLKPKLTFIK